MKPSTLQKGDLIGIYSPSSPATYTAPKRFNRAKQFLENKGFHIIEGSLTGKHEQFNDSDTNRKPYEILLEVLDGVNIPIIADFDCCHTHPMLTIPLGIKVAMDATNKKVAIVEEWIR